jgi:predicted site-specific integrase-resolvase
MKTIYEIDGNKYVLTRDAAKMLGVSMSTAWRWMDSGKLNFIQKNFHERFVSHDSVLGIQKLLRTTRNNMLQSTG